jgi:hypothetical protein
MPRGRELLQHPGALKEPVEAVALDARLDADGGLAFKLQLAMQLPPRVAPEAAAMAQVVMAFGQALRVVAQLVLAKQTKRPSQPDLHTAVNECVFEPLGCLEAVMDKPAVAAQRVAEEQHEGGAGDEDSKRRPCEGGEAADDSRQRHASEPQGLQR